MLVGRTVEVGAMPPEVKLPGDGLGDVGFCFVGACACACVGSGAGVGPSLKSPQSSKFSSSQVGCGGAGFVAACFFFGGDFGVGFGVGAEACIEGVGLLEAASVNSPQSPNESSSHFGSGVGEGLMACRGGLFPELPGGFFVAGIESSIDNESSKSTSPVICELCGGCDLGMGGLEYAG